MPIGPDYLLTNEDELLHRNAHPTFINNGRITSQVFRVTRDDNGELSVQQNNRAIAAIAYGRYTARGRESCGVWSVTIAECAENKLSAYDDPIINDPTMADDDSHALIDLTSISISQAKNIADKLANKARERGCQYSPAIPE